MIGIFYACFGVIFGNEGIQLVQIVTVGGDRMPAESFFELQILKERINHARNP
jgi:hypothetical protein